MPKILRLPEAAGSYADEAVLVDDSAGELIAQKDFLADPPRHTANGKPTSCNSNSTPSTSSAPCQSSAQCVRPTSACSAARPPPKVSAILISASNPVAQRVTRARATV